MKNNSPHKRRNKVCKHGISALQIYRFECSDTHLGRGFRPYDPEQKRRRKCRQKITGSTVGISPERSENQ